MIGQLIGMEKYKGLPLYLQLKNYIENFIVRRSLKPGFLLPTEQVLGEKFGVSRSTIRHALAQLEIEGTIERKPGKGTFVVIPRFRRSSPELTSFTEDMLARGYQAGSRLIGYRKMHKNLTSFAPDKEILQIIRLRLANDEPIGIQYLHIPKEIAERVGFTRDMLKHKKNISLYKNLEEAGFVVDVANEKISLRPANEFESEYLKVKVGEMLFLVHRETMSIANELLEVVDAVYLPDKYEYTVQLKRVRPREKKILENWNMEKKSKLKKG